MQAWRSLRRSVGVRNGWRKRYSFELFRMKRWVQDVAPQQLSEKCSNFLTGNLHGRELMCSYPRWQRREAPTCESGLSRSADLRHFFNEDRKDLVLGTSFFVRNTWPRAHASLATGHLGD